MAISEVMMARVLEHPVADRAYELHERDFYSWCRQQAELVRLRQLSAMDLDHIAEELTILGNELERSLRSSYRVLLIHLLTWRLQPTRRSRSWRLTILRERGDAAEQLNDNPGLKQHQMRLFAEGYGRARKEAAAETGLPPASFPLECPFPIDQALDEDFWPEAAAGAR